MIDKMTRAERRPMSFDTQAADDDASGTTWRWSVFDDPDRHPVRSGQVAGDRDKAERAARMAMTLLGGTVTDGDED